MSNRVCDVCGSESWGEGHFFAGRVWCRACWSGRTPAKAMPPTPHQRALIRAWIAPRTGTPARQLSFSTRELVKPGEGVSHGS